MFAREFRLPVSPTIQARMFSALCQRHATCCPGRAFERLTLDDPAPILDGTYVNARCIPSGVPFREEALRLFQIKDARTAWCRIATISVQFLFCWGRGRGCPHFLIAGPDGGAGSPAFGVPTSASHPLIMGLRKQPKCPFSWQRI
jgi:hypothetical protein